MSRTYAVGISVLLLIGALFLLPATAQRQYLGFQRLFNDLETDRRPPKDTEFVFARVQYNTVRQARGMRGFRGYEGWAHDYPDAEEHILQLADEATGINLNKDSYVIVRLDSDEIFQYPFLYFSEVGEMYLTPREIENFREYLNRGGFAMVDDFDFQEQLDWFASQMRQVFPDRSFVELKVEHPIFHTFYEITTLDVEPPMQEPGPPKFYGLQDEHGRLCMIINHNTDIGDFWEWIDQPIYPLAASKDGIQFGINYLMYSLTH
ncbi:MAG: DUF4159 domain-containing protein [Acidobacteria bacterium]|nr:DUF4159 domain-containing protein [Acidobacteriota bacterium]